MADGSSSNGSVADALPVDRLKQVAQTLVKAATDRAVNAALDQVDGLTDRLTSVAENGGQGLRGVFGGGDGSEDTDESDSGGGGGLGGALKKGASAVKGALGNVIPGLGDDSEGDGDGDSEDDGSDGGSGGGGSGRGKFKFMNIFEAQDVGVPIRVVYDQWTQFADFPSFMKKLESVNQESDEKSTWTAKVFWSRRSWETTIREQVADSHIIWVSSGAKGYADGIVSFHELAPNMTRIILVMEYYPQGFMEKTGNLWRAVGRRARLEFKHFCRHVMMDTLINREELEGWRGEIRDSEVVKTHEEAMEEEQAAAEDEQESDEYADDEFEDDGDEEYDDEEFAAEDDGELAEDEAEDDLADDELPEDDTDVAEDADGAHGGDEDRDEDRDEVEDAEEPERPRRRARRQRVPA